MTGEHWRRPFNLSLPVIPHGLKIEVVSREGAIFAHSYALGLARGWRRTGCPAAAAAALRVAGELRRWAAGSKPRFRDGDAYPTVIETYERVIPRWTDDA